MEGERELIENEYELVSILSSSKTEAPKTYLVSTDIKFHYYGTEINFNEKVGGKLNCYDDKNVFKGYYELLGSKSDTSYYVQSKDNNGDPVGLKCEVIMVYNDFTLINPTEVVIDADTKTVTWKNMANIFPYLTPKPTNAKMLCGAADAEIDIDTITAE